MDGAVTKQQAPGMAVLAARLFNSTLGQKAVMAVTGLALVGFALGHMVGHLQMFLGPDAYNNYAHALQSLGGLLWAARIGLLVLVAMHIKTSMALLARNTQARPIGYADKRWLRAGIGARTMRVTGPILAFFILFHLLQFTVMAVAATGFKELTWTMTTGALKGHELPNVYERMVVAFGNPLMAIFYVVATGLLSVHLSHGITSMFQTLGLTNASYRPMLEKAGPAVAFVLWAGFASVPLAILFGVIRSSVG